MDLRRSGGTPADLSENVSADILDAYIKARDAEAATSDASDAPTSEAGNKDINSIKIESRRKLNNALTLTAAYLGVLSFVTMFYASVRYDVVSDIYRNAAFYISLLVFVVSVYFALLVLVTRKSSEDFLDIDAQKEKARKKRVDSISRSELVSAIKAANMSARADREAILGEENVNPSNGEGARVVDAAGVATATATANAVAVVKPKFDRFETFIREVLAGLDDQIVLSEKKASLLLSKGTLYLFGGIVFYIVTIIYWQLSGALPSSVGGVGALSIFGPLNVAITTSEHNAVEGAAAGAAAIVASSITPLKAVGMLSCSFAFLVIEFLAAWFLRQYRNFVDMSAQLEQVKAMYNRYHLAYLGIQEFSDRDGSGAAKMRAEMLKALAKDIKWPVVAQGGGKDVNHMVELFESLGKFLDKAKNVTKVNKPEKPSK